MFVLPGSVKAPSLNVEKWVEALTANHEANLSFIATLNIAKQKRFEINSKNQNGIRRR